jgi:hypothetical protein
LSKQVFVDAPVPAALAAPLPGTVAGQPSSPVEPRPPEEVLLENLEEALGFGDLGLGHASATGASDAVAFDGRAVAAADPAAAPAWLLVLATGLPLAVLTATPAAVRRRPVASRRSRG